MSQQGVSFVGPGEHACIWRSVFKAERRILALEKHKELQTRARVEMSADNDRLWRQVAELQDANKKLQTQSELLRDRVDNVIELLKIARNDQVRLEEANAKLEARIEALEKQQEARQYAEIHKGSLEPPRRQYS